MKRFLVIPLFIVAIITACDSDSSSTSAKPVEKALSCEVTANENTIQTVLTYPDKKAVFTGVYTGGTYALKEDYTGVDASTLAKVCEAYTKEEGIKDVSCSGSTITYNSNLTTNPGFDEYVVFQKTILCPSMINGSKTLEDIWFQN